MTTSTMTTAQVVSLVKRLPAATKREALLALASTAARGRQKRQRLAQARLRRLAAEKGRDWDRMNDGEREDFIDALLHEGKACR
jgi:hypothetical protein